MADLHRGGFRVWEGALLPSSTRFWVLAASDLGRIRASRWSRILVYLSAIPLLVMSLVRFGTMLASGTERLAINIEVLDRLLSGQVLFAVLLAGMAGGRLIAEDRRTNALSLYLARPLSAGRYLLGKGVALGVLLASVYTLPAVLYVLVEALTAPQFELLALAWRMARTLAVTTLHTGSMTLLALALSASGRKPKLIAIAWIALYLVTDAASEALGGAFRHAAWTDLLSLRRLMENSALWVLHGGSGWSSALVLAGLCAVSVAALRWQVSRMGRSMVSS